MNALWGAIGVDAIALCFAPGLAAHYRLVKWALWGVVLVVLAGAYARTGQGKHLRFLPPDRLLFTSAGFFALWAVLAPWPCTPFKTAHAAGVLRIGMGFSLAWLVALHLSEADLRARQKGLLVLAAGGALLALIVLLQAAGWPFLASVGTPTREFRTPGTMGNPNWVAAFLLPLVPILLGLRAGLSPLDKMQRLRPACLGMALLIGAATLATGSKAGSLALAAGIFIYILLGRGLAQRVKIITIIGALTVAAAALIWSWSSGALQAFTWTRGRLFIWKACLMLIASHPFTGIGLGGFQPGYPLALPRLLNGDPSAYMPLHRIEFAYNDMLQTAVNAGLPAALLLAALIFVLVRRAYQRGDELSRGVGAAIAAMALYGCADAPLQLPATSALWWFLLGWSMAGTMLVPHLPDKVERHRSRPSAVLTSGIILLGLFQAGRFGAADIYWTQGRAALAGHAYSQAAEAMGAAAVCMPENEKLLSETAGAFLLDGRESATLEAVDQALLVGFSFDDLFLRQKVIKRTRGAAATVSEWQHMADDFPALFTPHFQLAVIYSKKGDKASARAELETVLRIHQHGNEDRPYKIEALRLLKQIGERPHK